MDNRSTQPQQQQQQQQQQKRPNGGGGGGGGGKGTANDGGKGAGGAGGGGDSDWFTVGKHGKTSAAPISSTGTRTPTSSGGSGGGGKKSGSGTPDVQQPPKQQQQHQNASPAPQQQPAAASTSGTPDVQSKTTKQQSVNPTPSPALQQQPAVASSAGTAATTTPLTLSATPAKMNWADLDDDDDMLDFNQNSMGLNLNATSAPSISRPSTTQSSALPQHQQQQQQQGTHRPTGGKGGYQQHQQHQQHQQQHSQRDHHHQREHSRDQHRGKQQQQQQQQQQHHQQQHHHQQHQQQHHHQQTHQQPAAAPVSVLAGRIAPPSVKPQPNAATLQKPSTSKPITTAATAPAPASVPAPTPAPVPAPVVTPAVSIAPSPSPSQSSVAVALNSLPLEIQQLIGSVVKVTSLSNQEIIGRVMTIDVALQQLILVSSADPSTAPPLKAFYMNSTADRYGGSNGGSRTPVSSAQTGSTVHLISLAFIQSIEPVTVDRPAVNGVTSPVQQTAQSLPHPIPAAVPLDRRTVESRKDRALRTAAQLTQTIGIGTSREGQDLFMKLSNTMNCRWHSASIIVYDEVIIDPPYTADQCKPYGHGGGADGLERVKRVVEGERTRLAAWRASLASN
ncbi:hypothetical protein GQ42DRAFT_152366 [Ramicandelaber brevisporus]|nr:hypothetical protein GQ42DRAFT_152366 [Ramicandelaber brevisporus]